MAYKIVNDDSLTSVANAIRVQGSISGTLEFPDGFVSAIQNLSPSPTLQSKSVAFTPAATIQTSSVTADAGYDGLSAVDVSVGAISSTYVGSGIARRSSEDMTRSGKSITAPSGYYSANAMYTMAEAVGFLSQSVDSNGLVTATYTVGTAGYRASGYTISSTQLSSLGATSYTPSTSAQVISSGTFLTGAQTIEAIPSAYIIPSGTYSITSNGIYDIVSFASVDVNVSGGGGGDHDAEDGIIARNISGVYENSRVTSVGSYAFYYCKSLTTASFPNATSIGNNAFQHCSSLTTASFPNATSIGNNAFYNCASLTTASFPNATSIGSSAFYSCKRLTTASFPNATSIGNNAFQNCASLTTASFSNATSIGNDAFNTCASLTTASFSNATSIGNNAFRNCKRLESLYVLASSVATLGTSAFVSTPMSLSSYLGHFGSIYVPASLVDSYKTTGNWAVYSARITSYEE